MSQSSEDTEKSKALGEVTSILRKSRLDAPEEYVAELQERLVERAKGLLEGDGISLQELIPPTERQWQYIIGTTLRHIINGNRYYRALPVVGWEPELLSVRLGLANTDKTRYDRFNKRWRDVTEEEKEFGERVEVRYTLDGSPDDYILVDTYEIIPCKPDELMEETKITKDEGGRTIVELGKFGKEDKVRIKELNRPEGRRGM